MIIDLKGMETTVLPNFKGGEKEYKAKMYFDGTTRIMRGTLEQGASIGYHKHETNSEVFLITSGVARCQYDDGEERLVAGDCHYCPRGHSHSLINASDTEPLEYFAIVPEQPE